MNLTKLRLANEFATFSPEEIEAALIGAMALVVYVKYRETREEVRSHYFDVIKKVDNFLVDLNEIRPFNMDLVKIQSYELFMIRYQSTTNPSELVVLSGENQMHSEFVKRIGTVPPMGLINTLLSHLQSIIRSAYVESSTGEK